MIIFRSGNKQYIHIGSKKYYFNHRMQYESVQEDVCESHPDDSILTGMYSIHNIQLTPKL